MPETPDPKLYSPSSIDSIRHEPIDRSYVELDIATNFSFLRGASHPDEYVLRAMQTGYGAIGIADINTLAGIVRMHVAAKEANLKLIVGVHLTLMDGPDLLVWVRDRAAYARLCRLLTLGKRRTEKGECHLAIGDVCNDCEGFFAAVIPPIDLSPDSIAAPLQQFKDAMGPSLSIAGCCDFTIDTSRRIDQLTALSRASGVPIVATNHVHYHDPSRRALQDVLTCTRHGCTIQEAGYRLFPNGERYLKSPEQMKRLWRDHPRALERTIDIADACSFNLDQLKYEYPDEIVPAGTTPIQHLTELTWAGAAERYHGVVPEKTKKLIEHELTLIAQLHFEAYFLTVYDLVKFARERGILCQGRGSAANSVVCFCIGVTSVDPERIDVLFERFVSSARNEPPDIDVDFEHERREEVIQYIYTKYGRDRAGMTAEVISYRGRSAVRDVGKALGFAQDQVDTIAKQLDWWHRGTITPEQIRAIGLDPRDRKVHHLMDLTSQLLGFPRHLGQHMGGMVMTRGPLCELVPIENARMEDRTVIEWDKDDIDALGMLKVDILALGMLTCISKCLEMVKLRSREDGHSQLHMIPPEDPHVYEMIQDADTVGVFQIESRAQMSMLPRLKPACYYDLVIEVAIVRPGPIQGDMVHPYLRRRDGSEPVSFPSEELRSVLGKTLGVPLFQEQAMRVVMVAAEFTGDEANRYRKAMAAWKKGGDIEKFESRILSRMIEKGYTSEFAQQLCLQLRGFGSYGFPESHAASFAHLVYASSWIKRYYPAAFCAGLLNSQPMGFYAPAQIVRDAIEHGVDVRGVDVNISEWDCGLEDDIPLAPVPGGEGRVEGVAPGGSKVVESHEAASSTFSSNSNPSSTLPLTLTLSRQGFAYRIPEYGGEGTGNRLRANRIEYDSFTDPRFLSASQQLQKSDWGHLGPAVRLGFRIIKGLRKEEIAKLVESRRRDGAFRSIEELHRRTHLSSAAIDSLAEADAFGSLQRSRRAATWESLAVSDTPMDLFDQLTPESTPIEANQLPAMSLGQEVLADYATTSLSLKAHPISLMRDELNRRGVITSAQLEKRKVGWVKVAGLVLLRQRPGTASGIVFMTLEDETGIVNLIVRPRIFDQYLAAARHGRILLVEGRVERNGKVIHVMARHMFDIGNELESGQLFRSRDFH